MAARYCESIGRIKLIRVKCGSVMYVFHLLLNKYSASRLFPMVAKISYPRLHEEIVSFLHVSLKAFCVLKIGVLRWSSDITPHNREMSAHLVGN